MTTEERVIRESLDRISTRMGEIDKVLKPNPLSDIIRYRQEFAVWFNQTTLEERTSPDILVKIKEHQERERDLFILVQEQIDKTGDFIREKAKLQHEEANLKDRLFWIERRKEKHAN